MTFSFVYRITTLSSFVVLHFGTIAKQHADCGSNASNGWNAVLSNSGEFVSMDSLTQL
jgi:hypothetical protein